MFILIPGSTYVKEGRKVEKCSGCHKNVAKGLNKYNQYAFFKDINTIKCVQLIACTAYTLHIHTKMAF